MVNNIRKISKFLFVFFIIILSNCTSSKNSTSSIVKFELEFGMGGGFTGSWNGYTIKNNGEYFSWTSRLLKKDSTYIGKIENEHLNKLWDEIQRINFFSLNYKNPGNMTCSIEISSDKHKNYVAWDYSAKDSTAIILSDFYKQLQKLCQNN